MTFLHSSRPHEASADTMTSLTVNMGVPDIPPKITKMSKQNDQNLASIIIIAYSMTFKIVNKKPKFLSFI